MHAESGTAAEVAYRIHVPAIIPMHTPQEAIAELEHCVGTWIKAIKIRPWCAGQSKLWPRRSLARPISSRRPDGYGGTPTSDSQYDYDPFWRRCVELA